MFKMHRMLIVLPLLALTACESKPPAEVSREQLADVRQTHAAIEVGSDRDEVLKAFESGNKVKLGSSVLGDAHLEEWKVEAFHDEDKRKDLFVTFLYFCNEKFVDSSDTRINYRDNAEIVDRWTSGVK